MNEWEHVIVLDVCCTIKRPTTMCLAKKKKKKAKELNTLGAKDTTSLSRRVVQKQEVHTVLQHKGNKQTNATVSQIKYSNCSTGNTDTGRTSDMSWSSWGISRSHRHYRALRWTEPHKQQQQQQKSKVKTYPSVFVPDSQFKHGVGLLHFGHGRLGQLQVQPPVHLLQLQHRGMRSTQRISDSEQDVHLSKLEHRHTITNSIGNYTRHERMRTSCA